MCVLDYSLRGNQATDFFQVALDRIMVDDIIWMSYNNHRETRPLEVMTLYSGWLTCGFRLMYPRLPEESCTNLNISKVYLETPLLLLLSLSPAITRTTSLSGPCSA